MAKRIWKAEGPPAHARHMSARPRASATALFAFGLICTLPSSGTAQAGPDAPSVDSTAVATVEAFHRALQARDTAAVRNLLAADVLVLESGGLETRADYLSQHLQGDMAFASAVTRESGEHHVTTQGDVAWVASTSRTTGTFRERTISSTGAELMVLTRQEGRWRIRAIHWSSRQSP